LRGPSRFTSMISNGFPASTATAARVLISGSPFTSLTSQFAEPYAYY
jgi:hypothetical protein